MSRKEAVLKIREALLKRCDILRRALAGDLSLLEQLEATNGDSVDSALESAQDEIASILAQVESLELARVEHALKRIREGSYGNCANCGTLIPLARLNALPYAILCIDCQREAESRGAVHNDSSVNWGHISDERPDDSKGVGTDQRL